MVRRPFAVRTRFRPPHRRELTSNATTQRFAARIHIRRARGLGQDEFVGQGGFVIHGRDDGEVTRLVDD
jgi:hypothetical protein